MIERTAGGAIVYHVRLPDPDRHQFEVTCRIERPAVDGQVLSLPAWIPGSYLIRDFSRHVVAIEASVDGDPVPLHKLDKQTWRVAPVDGELVVRARVQATDRSVRGSWLDRQCGFFNGTCLFLRVQGHEDASCVVHVDPPETGGGADWQVATSLERLTGTRFGWGAFCARNYEDLIDHPVLMGRLELVEWDVRGVPHVLAVEGLAGVDAARLRRDLTTLCEWHSELFGSVPMDRYWFLLRPVGDGYGGLEHACSSALIARRGDIPLSDTATDDASYRRFLGLVSHEYFHSWHVKRIRPAELVGADLSREAYTRQLWLFEGITSYYDDLALARSGLVTPQSYLELLGKALTRFYRSAGRRHQTLEESSFDAWIKFYRPDDYSPNTTVSYYLKGALVALTLDLEIRLRSDGKRSLDDVMRALWLEYGTGSTGVPEGAFARLARESTGVDLDTLLRQCLQSTVDPPVGILLAQFGIRLKLRAAEGGRDPGGRPGRAEGARSAWLGFQVREEAGQARIGPVADGSPASRAGLMPGDELLGLAGERVRAGTLDGLLDRLQPGRRVPVLVSRDDRLLQLEVDVEVAPKNTCYLVPDPDANPAAVARRRAWLGHDGDRES